jgi:magnesium-transporting ATPase (P-type)
MQKGEEAKIKLTAEKLKDLDVSEFKYHKMDVKEVIKQLNSNSDRGLTQKDAEERLAKDGPNELEKEEETPLWDKIKE